MNDEHDPLENELALLRPRDPSPELERRISEQLSSVECARQRPNKHPQWNLAFASGLVAASLLVMLFWQSGDRSPKPRQEALDTQPILPFALDPALPSHWTYHTALVRSEEQFVELLTEHGSQRSPEHDLQVVPHRGMLHANADLRLMLQGEL